MNKRENLCDLFAQYEQAVADARAKVWPSMITGPSGQRAEQERLQAEKRAVSIKQKILRILEYYDKQYEDSNYDGYRANVPPWFEMPRE